MENYEEKSFSKISPGEKLVDFGQTNFFFFRIYECEKNIIFHSKVIK